MEVLPKLIYRFHIIPVGLSVDLFVEIDKMILKSQNCKGPRIATTALKKNNLEDLALLNFKMYY